MQNALQRQVFVFVGKILNSRSRELLTCHPVGILPLDPHVMYYSGAAGSRNLWLLLQLRESSFNMTRGGDEDIEGGL